MQKLLRLPQVIERTSLRRSTIYEKMGNGSFPKPVKLNLRANGWLESEVNGWVEARIAEREGV
ncbi:helix-turn-helix transcriptional regulator [Brevundimonas subvibrioides]|uniref:helix-turn-helix transcriptional regulator n=1 Tax=Brevundimonas subvibrioides TaxID=74313 RepID=UPI0022B35A51|nr:AlpA family transcriptional regulator [Brevundimonas subvibrioides]